MNLFVTVINNILKKENEVNPHLSRIITNSRLNSNFAESVQEKAIAHGALELLEEYLREHGSDTGTAQMALLTIGSLTDSGRVCTVNNI